MRFFPAPLTDRQQLDELNVAIRIMLDNIARTTSPVQRKGYRVALEGYYTKHAQLVESLLR